MLKRINMQCKNLRIRKRKDKKTNRIIIYKYCTVLKTEIKEECYNCIHKEYKCTKSLNNCAKVNFKNKKCTIKGKKHKLTKATEIPTKIKKIVWERDEHKCIFCHVTVPWNCANSHYIKRSHLGLGIEKDIFTACPKCHYEFDDTPNREWMLPIAKNHLMDKYDDWNEDELVYKKS